MVHHMSTTLFSSFFKRLKGISIIAATVALVLALGLPSSAQETKKTEKQIDTEPVITAVVSRLARLTIYNSVVALPVLVDGNTIDPAITHTFYQALLDLQKYRLVPLENSMDWLERQLSRQPALSQKELVHQAGVDLHASGVIFARLEHRNRPSSILEEAPPGTMTSYTFTMTDTRSGKTVWNLHISRQNTEQQPETAEVIASTIREAMDVLRREMVKNGDIFSTELPKPEVLSAQGDIRSVRIVLQPDPPHVFSRYRLLRADSPDSRFSAAGSPVANKVPLILIDKDLQDATSYYYTVIGLTREGFANIPGAPFKVTTTGPPAPVNNFYAAGGSLRHVQLFWEPSQDPRVTGYVLFRSRDAAGPFEQIAEINGRENRTYVDKGQPRGYSRYGTLEDNHTYFYTIRTRNVVGIESRDSRIVSVSTKGPPQPPLNLQAINRQPQKIPLAWSAVPDPQVVGYAIYRALSPDGPFAQIDYVSGRGVQQYVDDGSWDHPLKNNTTYWYRLRSVNVVEVESSDSVTVQASTKAAPEKVSAVRATGGLFRQIKLEWSANAEPDIEKYEIYRGTAENNINTFVASVNPDWTSYIDTDLGDSRTYWYRIRAVDEDGLAGDLSELVQATTKQPPIRPSGLKAAVNDMAILISWNVNPEQDIDYYELTSGGFLEGIHGTTMEPRFLVRLEDIADTELSFRVRAVDRDGLKSEYSDPLLVVPRQ